MMLKEDFIKWLETVGAEYQDCSVERKQDCVFVFGKDEAIKKREHPKKYKDLYVPYIRITWHWEDPRVLYTRWNGLTGYMNETRIKDIILNNGI